jgi:hypothetical protein
MMQRTPAHLEQCDRDGYLFFPSPFIPEEIQILLGEVPRLYALLAHVLRPVLGIEAVRVRREMEQMFAAQPDLVLPWPGRSSCTLRASVSRSFTPSCAKTSRHCTR